MMLEWCVLFSPNKTSSSNQKYMSWCKMPTYNIDMLWFQDVHVMCKLQLFCNVFRKQMLFFLQLCHASVSISWILTLDTTQFYLPRSSKSWLFKYNALIFLRCPIIEKKIEIAFIAGICATTCLYSRSDGVPGLLLLDEQKKKKASCPLKYFQSTLTQRPESGV